MYNHVGVVQFLVHHVSITGHLELVDWEVNMVSQLFWTPWYHAMIVSEKYIITFSTLADSFHELDYVFLTGYKSVAVYHLLNFSVVHWLEWEKWKEFYSARGH